MVAVRPRRSGPSSRAAAPPVGQRPGAAHRFGMGAPARSGQERGGVEPASHLLSEGVLLRGRVQGPLLACGTVQAEPAGHLGDERVHVRPGRRDMDFADGVDQVEEAALPPVLGQARGRLERSGRACGLAQYGVEGRLFDAVRVAVERLTGDAVFERGLGLFTLRVWPTSGWLQNDTPTVRQELRCRFARTRFPDTFLSSCSGSPHRAEGRRVRRI